MNKKVFEDDLISGMQHELRKQASEETPSLVTAAECLHSALEIFEDVGLKKQASQILNLLSKMAQSHKHHTQKMPSIDKLMEAGLTQHDLREFSKGSPVAKAKFNIVLRSMGYSDTDIAHFIGAGNFMTDKDAKEIMDPNRSFGKIWQWTQDPNAPLDPNQIQPGENIEFTSLAKKTPSRPDRISDRYTKGLTPERMIANLKNHGTEFNMADDDMSSEEDNFEQEYQTWLQDTRKPSKLTSDNVDPELAGLLDVPSFDMDASDDELLNMEVADDLLEVFDADVPIEDFEDERTSLK